MSAEIPQPNQEQQLVIKNGLSALALPELHRENWYDPMPTEAEALGKLNAFLDGLNQQGADLVTIVDLEVNAGQQAGPGEAIKTKKVAIVRKGTAK